MVALGVIAMALYFGKDIPISLLPEVSIPRITVSVSAPDKTARIIENTITRPLRNQLLQMRKLEDIHSSSRNGSAFIEIELRHGTDTDLAFIEANEKIDQAMNFIPRDVIRPRVVKSTISDIPVFYLACVPKEEDQVDILELTDFAEKVIKRRLEQLEEIAFADIHGVAIPEVIIVPDQSRLQALNVTEIDLSQAIQRSNVDIGNVLIRDGQYQYNVEMGGRLESIRDVEQVYLNINDQVYQLNQLASVELREKEPRSGYLFNERDGVIFSVRKKDDANNFKLKAVVNELLEDFDKAYPLVNFHLVNDQSSILEISYNNLRTSLLYGLLFANMVLFLFFREWRMPLLIIITVPMGLLLSLLGFITVGISINIISLSGLILGVGLMIDNAIIIIDNIRQEQRLQDIDQAVVIGTNDVIRPLLSSALTTCSVFLPLILISGIAGALFYDQAISITIALTSSLLVSYFVIPVMARILLKESTKTTQESWLSRLHHRMINLIIRFRWMVLILFIALTVGTYFILNTLDRTSFPEITASALELKIDWNANIDIHQNKERINRLFQSINDDLDYQSSIVGEKQFILIDEETSINEAELLLAMNDQVSIDSLSLAILSYFSNNHPQATITVSPQKNTFDYIFSQEASPLIAYLQPADQIEVPPIEEMEPVIEVIRDINPSYSNPPQDEYVELKIRDDVIGSYGVDYNQLLNKIKTMFNANEVSQLRSADRFIPIVIGSGSISSINEQLSRQYIQNNQGSFINIDQLVSLGVRSYYKQIRSNLAGENYEVDFDSYDEAIINQLKESIVKDGDFRVAFGGSYYETRELLQQMESILLIVLLLLYLILAAQFESFFQPILVLLIVPLSIGGALLLLYLGGGTINLVSMVGLIIMAGIIVNDAILKIDMINKNKVKGMSLADSIIHASTRRIRPIVMTSLTTILAFSPVLFTTGIGAELQRPLALTIIGGLVIGTVSSLVFIPVLYYLTDRSNWRD